MKDQLYKLINSKNIVINEYIIKASLQTNLNLQEFLVLSYLINANTNNFDIELISKTLGMDTNSTMESFNSLMIKGLVTLETVKDDLSMLNEVVKLDEFYKLVEAIIKSEDKKEVKDDVFKKFEQELGRPMSPMELERINKWLSDNIEEELIIGALKEAVLNGVTKFRYIEAIIYEWTKKGLKNMKDVNKYMKSRTEEQKNKQVSKKEEEISDFNWLDDDN